MLGKSLKVLRITFVTEAFSLFFPDESLRPQNRNKYLSSVCVARDILLKNAAVSRKEPCTWSILATAQK